MFRVQSKNSLNIKSAGLIQPESLRGKRIIVRCDFNVPISGKGEILDTTRITGTYRTLNYLKNSGAKIIILSHIGRDPEATLKPVYEYLKKTYKVTFSEELCFPDCKKTINNIDNGEIVLFENIRQHKGETENDPAFAKLLASLGQIYVNEAFSVSHREHASIVGIPEYIPSFVGLHFQDEIDNLSKVFEPEHPFLVLMGGAKFNTKINLIEVLDKKADHIFIGGALSNDIYRARGLHIGNSKVSEIDESVIKKFMNLEKVSVPVDVEVLNKEKKNTVKPANNIKEDETIVDGGPETFKILEKQINSAKMIIWNGPFGLYEDGYDFLTRKVAKAIGKSSAFSIVGGGDTLTEISRRGNHDDYDFVSLGGGAMLEFISNGTLVGIEAIENGF